MKKLAILCLLVAAACTRQVNVGTAEGPNAPGGANARDAVQKFLAAAKAENLQAMAGVWGTSEGPARSNMERAELEQREIVMLCYLKHDNYTITNESPATNRERVFSVDVTYKDLTRTANFFATEGPGGRWYLRSFEMEKLTDICQRR
ncbi:MAG: hypothetical protein ACREOK_16645 [Gemmatimonadaceae bacterium]